MNEREQLHEMKTVLLRELHSNMKEENEAIMADNIQRLERLNARATELMTKIDDVDARLREFAGPLLEGEGHAVPTAEQRHLLLEMKQLHKEIVAELIRQRTAVVGQLKELREVDHVLGMYNKGRSMEGMLVDHKK